MTHTRYAFVKAGWHADVVDKALQGFLELVPSDDVDVYDVPGAFELSPHGAEPCGNRKICRRRCGRSGG